MESHSERPISALEKGGRGTVFEMWTLTYHLIKMLVGAGTLTNLNDTISSISFQLRSDQYRTDDFLVVSTDDQKTTTHRLLVQVKHSIRFNRSDKNYRKVVENAFIDFNNAALFNRETDKIALYTRSIFAEASKNITRLLELARAKSNSTEFFDAI